MPFAAFEGEECRTNPTKITAKTTKPPKIIVRVCKNVLKNKACLGICPEKLRNLISHVYGG